MFKNEKVLVREMLALVTTRKKNEKIYIHQVDQV